MDNGHSTTASTATASRTGTAATRVPPQGRTGAAGHLLAPTDTFVRRHIGPSEQDVREMLEFLGFDSLEALIDAAVPDAIRLRRPLKLGPPPGEFETLGDLKAMAS